MKKLFAFLLLGVFMMGLTSAFGETADFDEKDGDYGSYSINGGWGILPDFLGGEEKAFIKLNENTDYCLIDCSASGEGYFYEPKNFLDGIEFKNKLGEDEKGLKEIKITIGQKQNITKEIPIYEEVCEESTLLNETNITNCHNNLIRYEKKIEEKVIYSEYNGEDLEGWFEWGISAKKNKEVDVDWILTIWGEELGEWAWWNGEWKFKKQMNFSITGNPTNDDFQARINLTWSQSYNNDFSDIRFLNLAENTELPYYIENKVDGEWADIWIRLDTNITTTNETLAYIYYNNSGTTSNSNENTTFHLIDNFNSANSTKWKIINGEGSQSVSGGIMTIDSDWVQENNETSSGVNYGHIFEMKGGGGTSWTDASAFYPRNSQTSTNDDAIWFGTNCNNRYWSVINDGSGTSGGCPSGVGALASTDELGIVYANSSTTDFYINNVKTYSLTSNNPDENLYVGFRGWVGGQITVDWVRVRGWNDTIVEYSLGQESSGTSITLNSPVDIFNSTSQTINFNGTVTSLVGIINVSLILNGIYNETNSSGVNIIDYLFTKTISDGNHNWTYESCNVDLCATATTRTFTIDSTSPQINISAPIGTLNYNFIGNNETLNVTFTDTNLYSCWYNYNGTNISIEGCLTEVKNSTQFILEIDNTNMTIYANDTPGNENSTFINWSYSYLENNRTHNTTSFQTETETFTINIEGATSASLFYNGTEYTTTKSGNDFTRTIQIPVANLGNNSIYWRFDDTQNSFTSYQNISETVFTLCNSSYTTTFLNISFKDEEDLNVINASIPTSTFEYWLGDGTVTKILSFINNTDNFNYEFCATPNRTFNFNSLIQYKQGSIYPQRVFSQDGGTLTNDTTDLTLYLLGVSDGLFVTFQVLNVAEQPISGVDVLATRILEGSDTPVAQGTTDAAGSVTFWLNPDFQHTITFTKTGSDTETLTIFPTQSAYTVSMGGGAVTEPDQTRGVSLVVKPQDSFLVNDTSYNFNYTVSSTYWNLEEFGFTLFYSNGTEIGTETSTASSGGILDIDANTLNSSYIIINYYYLINETYTNATRIWYIQNSEGTEYSIWNFFQRFTTYTNAGLFGFDDFGKALISFLILVLVAGGLSFRYGINSEVAIMGIIFGLVLVLDVGLGLIPNPQLATQAGIENIITVITGILLFGILVKEELR